MPKKRVPKGMHPKQTAAVAQREDRRRQVGQLLLAGATHPQIAKALDCSTGTVSDDIKRIRTEWREERCDDYKALVDEAVGRLKAMLRPIWPSVLQGDLKAIETALKINDQLTRMLGIGTPVSQLTVNLNVGDPLEALECKWRETLAARSLSELVEITDDGASPLARERLALPLPAEPDPAERRELAVGEVVNPGGPRLWQNANWIGMGEGASEEVPVR